MIKVINGNSIEELKKYPDNYFGSVVTDPPYGLSAARNSGKKSKGGFMGKKWDYDVPSVELWKEVFRVLKEGGYLLSFAGTRTQHRMAVNIEDAGFEIRDMIAWVYGSGFPKSHNIGKAVDKLQGNERKKIGESRNGKNSLMGGLSNTTTKIKQDVTKGTSEWEGWGTALKPALEPITMARKPFKTTVVENVLKNGVGGINIDECRVEYQDANDKDSAIPQGRITTKQGQFAGRTQGIGKDNELNRDEWKQKQDGRFPSNFIHDGSDEVTDLFPITTCSPKKTTLKNSNFPQTTNTYGKYSDDKRVINGYGDNGNASRFFYCAKASKQDRNEGLEDFEYKRKADRKKEDGKGGENPRNRTNTKKQNHHPTVKPTDLMRYLVRLVTPKNEIVLDCFMGSGSTGKACALEGLSFVGIDLDKDYCEIAKARIDKALEDKRIMDSQTKLF